MNEILTTYDEGLIDAIHKSTEHSLWKCIETYIQVRDFGYYDTIRELREQVVSKLRREHGQN